MDGAAAAVRFSRQLNAGANQQEHCMQRERNTGLMTWCVARVAGAAVACSAGICRAQATAPAAAAAVQADKLRQIAIPAIIAVAVILLILIISMLLRQAARKKHEKILSELESDRRDPLPLEPRRPPSRQAPPVSPSRPAPVSQPSAEPRYNITVPQPKPADPQQPVYFEPQPARPPVQQPPVPAPQPQTAAYPEDLVEKVRQEIYREVVNSIRAKHQNEYETHRRAMLQKMQDFIRELQGIAADLNKRAEFVDSIPAAQQAYMGQSVQQLKQVLDRFEKHGF